MTSCLCGCGEEINTGKRFIWGHHVRIKNPMNNPESRAKLQGEKNPFYGKKHTEETKQKISVLATERIKKLSPDVIASRVERMAVAVKGVLRSEEHRNNLSKACKGKIKTAEHIAKFTKTIRDKYASGELIGTWKGKKLSQETRIKMSTTRKLKIQDGLIISWNKGKTGIFTEETLKKMSEGRRGKMCGLAHPRYGKHCSDETKRKIGESNRGKVVSKETRNKLRDFHRRNPLVYSAEYRRKLSNGKKGNKNPMYGKTTYYKKILHTNWLGKTYNLRSSYEKAYAEWLDRNRVNWGYEVQRFELVKGMATYLPDFFIYSDDGHELEKIIEVKGRWREDDIFKVNMFREFYSCIPLVVLSRNELNLHDGIRVK